MKVEQRVWTAEKGWQDPNTGSSLSDAQIVFMFGGVDEVEASDAFDKLREAYPKARICGCSTAGEIMEARVYDGSVTATAVHFEHTEIKIARIDICCSNDSFDAGKELANKLEHDGLRHIFIVSDGLNVNGSDFSRGLNSTIPAGITVSGGFAGDVYRFKNTYTWCDDKPAEKSIVAIGFYGDRIQVSTSVSHGWSPFGPDRTVTKSEGNVLHELDGQPVLGLYKSYLGDEAAELPTSALRFPIQLHDRNTEGGVVRTILGVDEEAQSMTFAGDIPQCSLVRLMFGTVEGLTESGYSCAENALNALKPANAQLSMLVSCAGRRPVLKQRIDEEIEAIAETLGTGSALTGFYSYGEIAPLNNGGQTVLHNQTLTLTCFSEV